MNIWDASLNGKEWRPANSEQFTPGGYL